MSAPETFSGWDASFEVPDADTLERLATLTRIQTRQTRSLGESLLGKVYGFALVYLDSDGLELPGLDDSLPMLYRAVSAVRGCVDGGGIQFMGYDNNQPVAVRVPLYQLGGFSFNGKLRLGQLPPLVDNEAIEVAMALGRVGQAADYRKLWPSPDLTSVMGYSPQRQIIEVTA